MQKIINGNLVNMSDAEEARVLLVDLDALKADKMVSIADTALATLTSFAKNPDPLEIASWPEKVKVAGAVLSGGSADLVMLAPTMAKHNMTAAQAAGLILVRERLFRWAKAACDMLQNATIAQIDGATTVGELLDAEATFQTALENHRAQFVTIETAATSGDMAPLDAAESEITGQ